ncbi:MAG: lysozyme inhibitor LprI family protein [Thermodesulfobacteriota bacterium]
MGMRMIGCGMIVLGLAWATPAVAASFDCAKAATQQEKLICGDPRLSEADEALAKAYRAALLGAVDKDGFKRRQQEWIRQTRNGCQDAPCLRNAYAARLVALEETMHKAAQEALREANERFSFQGKPINPRMLEELLPWLSDNLPGPVAVDLAGGENRYFAEINALQKGGVRAVWDEGNEQHSCQYQHLGRLANGMHVVRIAAQSGGSGIFTDLLLVRFLVDAEYGDGGMRRNRLLMMRAGSFPLGDRYDGAIAVQADTISIGPGGGGLRAGAKTEVISIK